MTEQARHQNHAPLDAHSFQAMAATGPERFLTTPLAAQALDPEHLTAQHLETVNELSRRIAANELTPGELDAGRKVVGALFDLKTVGGSSDSLSTSPVGFRYNAGLIKGFYAKDFLGSEGVAKRFEQIADGIRSFGFMGKAPFSTQMKVGTNPPMDVSGASQPTFSDPDPAPGYVSRGYPEGSPAAKRLT